MPQNARPATVAANAAGAAEALDSLPDGALLTADGRSKLRLTAADVVSTDAKRLVGVLILAPGSTSGTFTLNDCDTTGAATAANTVFTIAYNATNNVAGAWFPSSIPLDTGLVVSAVPGGGSPAILVVYN